LEETILRIICFQILHRTCHVLFALCER
jgi:hypothetical protein